MKKNNEFRIMIIDDNPDIHRDFIKILTAKKETPKLDDLEAEIFEKSNNQEESLFPLFKIDTASQGQEGVQRIKEGLEVNNPYALAFVDIRMPPGWDGIETIKYIWALDPNIQIVICTAFSDYTWEETIHELGTTDNLLILKKPFDTVAVRQLAAALTKKWQLMQEVRAHSAFLEKRVEERTNSLRDALSVTRATLESTADGVLVLNNKDKVIIDYNKQFLEIWKIPEILIKNKEFKPIFDHMLLQLKTTHEFVSKINMLREKSNEISSEFYKFKDKRVVEGYTQPQHLEGQIVGRVWSFRDVTKRIILEKKLLKQATHDALTGFPNRVLLMDRIYLSIAKANRTNKIFGLLFFDLDRFKLVNDSLSHRVGDKLLQAISKRLLAHFRAEDTIARLGGDEFVMIASELDQDHSIFSIGEKLLNIFKNPFKVEKRNIFITSSIGISLYPQDGKTPDELLSNADLAMYRAKELGTNQFQFYTHGMNQASYKRLQEEGELRRAIEKNEFFLVYQPQFDFITKKIVSTEALIRWNHPRKGVVFPLDFIPLAEETGLIVPIGEWALRTACAQNKAWQESGIAPMRVAVNVASCQFKQPNLVEKIKKILNEVDLKPEFLEIEITENIIVGNPDVLRIIAQLKKIGVHIALDDFGTGNSSLSYLKKVKIDHLKIDKSFVHNIDINRIDEVIIKAVIEMARSLNYKVLAEGVETEEQMTFLQDKHCQTGQGFLFSEAMTAEKLEALMLKD